MRLKTCLTLLACSVTILQAENASSFGGSIGMDSSGSFRGGFTSGGRSGHGGNATRDQKKKEDDAIFLVQQFMRKYDLERLGTISRDQFMRAWNMRFREFDPQGSGVITPESFKSHLQPRDRDKAMRWFAAFDTNHEGKITPEKFQSAGKRLFDRLDHDNSGVLTKEKLLLGLTPNDAANF